MNDARWPDAMAVDSLGGTGASPARAVKFKIRGFRTRRCQKLLITAVKKGPYPFKHHSNQITPIPLKISFQIHHNITNISPHSTIHKSPLSENDCKKSTVFNHMYFCHVRPGP